MERSALFLDRDGVINVDHGYVYRREDFHFTRGIFDLVRIANERNYLVVVVTNQAGIGRGYYTEKQFHALTDWMRTCFIARNARIDSVYFCPFHPEHGVEEYKRESRFRKPNPGMLLQAAREWKISLGTSVLVGDKISDMAAAASAGITKYFLYRSADKFPGAEAILDLAEVVPSLQQR